MGKVEKTDGMVGDAVEDGVYTAEEHAALKEAFTQLSLPDRFELLHRVQRGIKIMAGGADQGVWNALFDVQQKLRQLMPGAGGKAPPKFPINVLTAKVLLRKYAADGVLDPKEQMQLKNILVKLDQEQTERLLRFARRRHSFGFIPERKKGFAVVCKFIEEHLAPSGQTTVDLSQRLS